MPIRKGPTFRIPPMKRRITLRNPEDEPDMEEDQFGRRIGTAQAANWGVEVRANKRDRVDTDEEIAEGVRLTVGRTIFTIRFRPDVGPDTTVVDRDGIEYRMIAAPVERGGPNGGMRARFLELHTERTTAKRTETP